MSTKGNLLVGKLGIARNPALRKNYLGNNNVVLKDWDEGRHVRKRYLLKGGTVRNKSLRARVTKRLGKKTLLTKKDDEKDSSVQC